MNPGALTVRQAEILGLILDHLERHGRPPTLAALSAAAGIHGPYAVRCHLRALERKGFIKRDHGAFCGIRVLKDPAGPRVTIEGGAIVVRGLEPLTATAAMALANELHLASLDLEQAVAAPTPSAPI
jgi:SOS-response transcriptional repressor LexA